MHKLLQKAIQASEAGKPLRYRDNMIFTFLLTTQLSDHWASNKRSPSDKRRNPQVEMIEN